MLSTLETLSEVLYLIISTGFALVLLAAAIAILVFLIKVLNS